MKIKKYNHTKKEAIYLWDIAMTCAVKGFNNELTTKDFLKCVDRFRTNLDKIIKKQGIA